MHGKKWLAATLSFALATPALAYDDVVGANILGMGGASAAHPADNSAITVNPGVIALESRYDISALFGYGPTQDVGWGMSVSDSQTNEWIGFGASYYGSIFDPPFRNDELPGWSPVGVDPINMKRTHTVGVGVG